MNQYRFHVNIISSRRQYNAVGTRNALPGLIFLASVIVISMLKLQDHWYFLLAVTGLFVSVIIPFFPFYSNALVHVSDEGITLQKGSSPLRTMKWEDITYITFRDGKTTGDFGSHIETIIGMQGEVVNFLIYQYLFNSRQKMTQALLRAMLEFPPAKDKLPGELVERYGPK
jgi:hypothetical protein